MQKIDCCESLRQEKLAKLRSLAEQRRLDDQQTMTRVYKQVGDFRGGVYDQWGLVSPWSKSACNPNSSVMIIAQDWTSEESVQKPSKYLELGYNPELPTNINLQNLLAANFGLDFTDIYATNLFVFVKPGNLSSRIPSKDMLYSAKKYTLAEIEIVQPEIVICLGSATFNALCRAISINPPKFKSSIDFPVEYKGSLIYGVPHTGAWGTKNAGGLDVVNEIWSRLATAISDR